MQAWEDFKNLELFELFGFTLATLALVFFTIVIFSAIASSGEADYCYLEATAYQRQESYTLKAHRNWKPDAQLGNFTAFEDALIGAARVNCPLLRTK